MDQISLFDYADTVSKRTKIYELLRDHYCSHASGYLRFPRDDKEAKVVLACSFKNVRPAKSWDDWQPCTEANCPFLKRLKDEIETDPEKVEIQRL